jgi:hypothetical protein
VTITTARLAARLRDLEQEYNAAVANGLVGKARQILRRVQAFERDVKEASS